MRTMRMSGMRSTDALAELLQAVRDTLVYMQQGGCTGFDCSENSLEVLRRMRVPGGSVTARDAGRGTRDAQTREAGRTDAGRGAHGRGVRVPRGTDDGGGVAGPRVADAPDGAAMPETLETIRADLGDCTRCGLCRSRTNIVFGEGDPRARLVFVGEGPGFEEDRSGKPFVGPAGQLLTRIIAAMKLSREAVYIGNIVKCRPPENRNPAPDEIHRCLPFLKRQLAAIQPDVICALGSVAAKTLLATDVPVSRLRGRFHTAMGIPVMPTFHPAYLLRYPEKKREVWEDVQLIMQRLS